MSDSVWQSIETGLGDLIAKEGLPPDFSATIQQYYYPLARQLQVTQQRLGRPLLVGINGAQGTGKSTLALFLQTMLSQGLDRPCVRFSLDDIYLTRAQRQSLATEVHPLLLTRGVPGTHDIDLGMGLLDQLLAAGEDDNVPIPAFDKAIDDRAPQESWPRHRGPVSVILLEGWCVAALPETDLDVLRQPINTLEQLEDPDGHWRQYVNQHLATDYKELFERLDLLVMLKAPSMECILEWRTLQEQKLANRIGLHQNSAGELKIMTPEQIKRFIMHYERLTRAMLAEMPARADVLFDIDAQHRITGVKYRD